MKRFKTWTLLPLLAMGVLLTRCSCDFFGTTGALIVPESKEIALGASFDSTLRANDTAKLEYPVFETRGDAKRVQFQGYVDSLAKAVLAQVPASAKPGYNFKFTLIDKDVENAFAVPGGYVYIYTGIIKKMNNEAELSGVIGHEISHVVWHHYRDALAKTAGMGLLLDALLGNDAGSLAKAVAGSLFQLAALKVSRSNESEADHYGTIYSGKSGRNPLGIANYFSRAKSSGFAWLSSHPGSEDRVEDVTDQVNEDSFLKSLAADSSSNYTDRFVAMKSLIQ